MTPNDHPTKSAILRGPRMSEVTTEPQAEQATEKAAEKAPQKRERKPAPVPGLLKTYLESAVPALTREFDYANDIQVPRINKVVINININKTKNNPKALETTINN